MWEIPEGLTFFKHLSNLTAPTKVEDFTGHAGMLGLPDLRLPVAVSSFLAVPIRHQGVNVCNIHVAKSGPGLEFSREDEETLVMFASQAALVIANARRHREEQRARANLEALVNTAPVGVSAFDARTGAVTSVNREAARIVSGLHGPGRTPEELLGVLTFRRADGRQVSLEEFPLTQALRLGETVRAEEMVIEVPDGRSVTVLVNATPIRSEEGEVESVVVTLQDLTALAELERQRAEFLGMVSHELRVPMSSIKGSATTLLGAVSDLDPAEAQQFFRIIDQQADRMRDLINNLLDVARIETGTLPVDPEPVEVAALVDRGKNTFLSGGGRRNLQIYLDQDLPRVMADRRRIGQVLTNLLSNAARYSAESSPITVNAALENFHVAISVADQGRGIAPEELPNLFRKFSRLGGESQGGETGLGLAICKGFVEAHGGRIWAESDGPGLGSRFTFTIPAVEEAATGPARHRARSGRGEREAERILAVDDDPQTLRYLRDALASAGYQPLVTADPEEALRLVEAHRPHLVLLDWMLPERDGIELMQDILQVAEVPVIFLSAYGRDQVIARAFEMGAADYIVKPFSPTELVARVGAALRRREPPRRVAPEEPFVLEDLTIDYQGRRVTVAGSPVPLTDTEYRLLFELSVNAGMALTYEELLQGVWGAASSGDFRLVRGVVRRLRRKLGDAADRPRYIFTETRVGYRMERGESEGGSESESVS